MIHFCKLLLALLFLCADDCAGRGSETDAARPASAAISAPGGPAAASAAPPSFFFPAPGSAAAAAPHVVAGLALPPALLALDALAAALLPTELGDAPLFASAQPLFPFFSPPAVDEAALSPRDRALLPPRPEREAVPLARLAERLRGGGAAAGGGDGRYRYYSATVADVKHGEVVREVASAAGRALAAHAARVAPLNATAQASVWLASRGACTPLHYDASDNVLSQLAGEKVITLYPPAAATAARLLPWASALQRSARAGLDGAAAAALPLGGHAATVVRLAAGESLFIPAYWLHHVCTAASASASLSVWVTDSDAQRGARALLAAPLPPMPDSWGRRERMRASAAIFGMVAGGFSGEASAALRSRYLADGEAALSRSAAGDIAAAAECTLPEEKAAKLRAGAALAPFLAAAERALRAQTSDAVRAIVVANWAENALMHILGVARGGGGGGEHGEEMVSAVRSCF